MDRLDVLVQVGDGQSLATVRALGALVVVHLPDVPGQVGHGELFVTVGARLLDLNNNYCNFCYLKVKLILPSHESL